MISRSLLQFCLVLLFSSEISCLDCNRIHVLQTRMNSESLERLEKMGGHFPFQCLTERTAFKPRDILKLRMSQQENAKGAIQQILQELFHIFNNNLTQAVWNEASIKEFQNGLHQQIENLGMCLSAEKGKEMTYLGNGNLLLTSLKLKRYFQTIDDFLKEKQYSLLCAKASDSMAPHLNQHTLPHGIDKTLYHASLPVEQSEQKEFRASEENEWKFPPQFINEMKAFKSTQDVVQLQLSQKENANVAIQEILQEIFTIFSKNLTQTAWDSSSIARFQNGLHQQIQRLELMLQLRMLLKQLNQTALCSDITPPLPLPTLTSETS
ncbi:interferon kappa-like [Macrochelys suwanniensis]